MNQSPGDNFLQRATPLRQRLVEAIRRSGPIPVAEYFAACLLDPDHGFYTSETVLGSAGHFITSPEISQIFGEIIGVWSAVVWHAHMGSPPRVTLAELGPGRGTMMADVLRAARIVPGYLDTIDVLLVEMSERLAALQYSAVAAANRPIGWSRDLTAAAPPLIVVANEFLDALPVQQWVETGHGWRCRAVGLASDGALTFTIREDLQPPPRLSADLTRSAPAGTVIEVRDNDMLAAEFARLAAGGPVAGLFIDYGYDGGSHGDTLQSVRAHQTEHPLASPGEADLSAHVDFAALARRFGDYGLTVDGPTTQAEFLGRLGILQRASNLMSANPAIAAEIESGVARLLAPGGMGTRFKVLGVRSRGLPKLPGF